MAQSSLILLLMLARASAFSVAHLPPAPCTPAATASATARCAAPRAADDESLTTEAVRTMFMDVRQHYRTTGQVEDIQVCRNMMVTRVNEFAQRIDRCARDASERRPNPRNT